MKIIVIGLGSMGKRRIRLMLQHYKDISLLGIDTKEDRRAAAAELFNIPTFSDFESAIQQEKPDAAFICISPAGHPQVIKRCLEEQLHVFTEINLINENHEELIRLADKNKRILFLSSTPLYRRELDYINNRINSGNKPERCHYRYHVGQYLPEWHPWESHKDFFVFDKKTNGCREIFAIELPWMIRNFGKIKNMTITNDTLSTLDLDYPDSYQLLIEHESGNKGTMNVDVVSPKAVRNLEIYSENMYISWDGRPDGLMEYDSETKKMNRIDLYIEVDQNRLYADNIIENAYLEEIIAFMGCLNRDVRADMRYTMSEELEVLRLIDTIEGSTI